MIQKTLVHCRHGVSRSAAVVIAFLMRFDNMNYDVALSFTRERRPAVLPNLGFQRQLILWQMMGFVINDSHRNYRLFQLMHHDDHNLIEYQLPKMSCDVGFKCRKCRRLLFCHNDLISHSAGWWEERLDTQACKLSLSVLPMDWMQDQGYGL